jgi:hypothetical protein
MDHVGRLMRSGISTIRTPALSCAAMPFAVVSFVEHADAAVSSIPKSSTALVGIVICSSKRLKRRTRYGCITLLETIQIDA